MRVLPVEFKPASISALPLLVMIASPKKYKEWLTLSRAMKMPYYRKFLASVLAVSAVATPVNAATFFTNTATFAAAAGQTTVENFDNAPMGAGSNSFFDFGVFSLMETDIDSAVNGTYVTGINSVIYPGSPGFEFLGGMGRVATIVGGFTQLSFAFDQPITAFGISVFDLGTLGQTDLILTIDGISTIVLARFEGDRTTTRFDVNDILYTTSAFAGVVDSRGFSSVSIQSSAQGDFTEFDNLQFVSAPVPEPSSWGLFILGFGIAGWRLRRRQVRFAATASPA